MLQTLEMAIPSASPSLPLLPSVVPGRITLLLLFNDGLVASLFRGSCGQGWESFSLLPRMGTQEMLDR